MKTPKRNSQPMRERWTRSFIQQYLRRSELQRLALADAEEDEPAPSYEVADAPPLRPRAQAAPHDLEELLPGQIRLLSQPKEMVWLLILRQWDSGTWLIVPFSPFSFPATEEEYLLGGNRTKYLDVLQFWNARTLNALFLRRSWLVSTLTPEEMQCVEILFDSSLSGDAVPDDLLANTGLPIVSADDPRLDYKTENLVRFTDLDSADLQMTELFSIATAQPVANVVTASATAKPAAAEPQKHRTILLPKLFSPLPMAAAGKNEVSVCWTAPATASALLAQLCQRQGRNNNAVKMAAMQYATWLDTGKLPCEAEATPVLMWEWPDAQKDSKGTPATADALFFHRKRRTLLGTGYALRKHDEGTIVLADWVVEEHPRINSPEDITIFLTAPEKV
ncbi:MAG TPA: hypothetical protein PLE92_10785 [Lentisphaeria bacterium]|nr:hypothetical protein [Lentisphaerota bacterium]OQC14927.1 MAG: hypothetical protein BWX73_01598 [Lentisphaerae bacterium ADurb.Bin082]HPY90316.1 hypothetical protein [Lentisphaeria bacterium]HQC53611.1 hypothetical protein [Lentisphaeria bacterium]